MTLADARIAINAYRPGGTSDWKLPSYTDNLGSLTHMEFICRYARNYIPTGAISCDSSVPLRANWNVNGDKTMNYWTSHPTSPSGASGYGTVKDLVTGQYWGSRTETLNYVRPILEFSYTAPPIPTTTTTLPQKCAQGGICKIGDVSPNGGLIVKFFGSGSNITYTEIAPRNWDVGLTGVDNGNGDEPLSKKSVAATVASKYRGGGKTDWHLPDIGEMRDAFTVTEVPTFTAVTERNGQRACRVTSAPGVGDWNLWGFYANYWISGATPVFSYPTGGVYPVVSNLPDVDASDWQYYVRPVRRGTYTGPAMNPKNPTYSPAECETVPMATTTTAVSTRTCAQGGWCQVGDEGQRGGVVISVDNTKPRGQRNVEIAKFGWRFGLNDCAGTSLFSSCSPGEWSSATASGMGDGYRLPTIDELQLVLKLPDAARARLQLINHYYWTGESSGKNLQVNVPLDRGDPFTYDRVETHWAIKISTGLAVAETYAYMRPVRAF